MAPRKGVKQRTPYHKNMITKGRGRIKCRICGIATSEHEIGPCPMAPTDSVKVSVANRIRGEFR